MNWIIKSTKKLNYHTNLAKLLTGDWINIRDYSWFLSELDVINFAANTDVELPIDFRDEFHVPTINDFSEIVDSGLQVVWGLIVAVKNGNPIFDLNNLPYVEGNDKVWESDYFQIPNSIVEITAWDSSCTIIKFRDESLSAKFTQCFPEAISLDEYEI